MKIRLSMQGMSLNVEVSEDKAMHVYRGLAEKLLLQVAGVEKNVVPNIAVEGKATVDKTAVAESVKHLVEEEMQKKLDPEEKGNLLKNLEKDDAPPNGQETEDEQNGYKGFLAIKCKACGDVKAFSSKYKINWRRCQACGKIIDLKKMVPLWLHCECGQRSHYYTNLEDPIAEIKCIRCGAPVAVEWNEKKKCYQTIEEKLRG